jgi:threonine dehydratase
LADKPGALANVAQIVGEEQGSIIKLDHNQFVNMNRSESVELRITMEAFGTEHKNKIVHALEEKGYRPRLVNTTATYEM